MKKFSVFCTIVCVFLIENVFSIYIRNEGIKTKSFYRDPRISEALHTETQPIVMHHQYSQVVSNRPGSEYVSQYNLPSDASVQSYQGSRRVYQQNTHVTDDTDRLGRTSSKVYEIENNIAPYQTECPAGATGQFPYSLDCRRFLNCWKGRGYIQSCAPGTVFNPDTLECDDPKKVACFGSNPNTEIKYEQNDGRFARLQENPSVPRTVITTTSTNQLVKCSLGANGIEPHPFDCTKFLNCAHGITHIQSCGPGTVFNPLMSVCDYPDKVDCGSRSANFDVTHTSNVNYEVRRPYTSAQQSVVISPTQATQRITTSYLRYPKTYTEGASAQQNLNWNYSQSQQENDHEQHHHYHHHPHHHNHHRHHIHYHGHGYGNGNGNYNLNSTATQYPSSTGWTSQSKVVYVPTSEIRQIVYPTKWTWNSVQAPSEGGYKRNVTRTETLYSGSSKPEVDVNVVYPSNSNADNNLQKPTNFDPLFKNPDGEQTEGQRPLRPDWTQSEDENENQRRVDWTSNRPSWNPTTHYAPSTLPTYTSTYSKTTPQTTYNRTWTSSITTTNREPSPTPGGFYIKQTAVHEIPKSNYNSNVYQNFSDSSEKEIFYEPIDSDEDIFYNVSGGDIPAHPSLTSNKNQNSHPAKYESDEDGQLAVPFESSSHKISEKGDAITSESIRHESKLKKEFDENDNLYGGLLPPEMPIPSQDLLPPFEDQEGQVRRDFSKIPIPSQQMLPPFKDEGEDKPNNSNVPVPSQYILPPLEDGEGKSKSNNSKIPIPSQHMLPPFKDEEESKFNSSKVPVPSQYMLPPRQNVEGQVRSNFSQIPIPSQQMLPPFKDDEGRAGSNNSKTPTPSQHLLPPFENNREQIRINSSRIQIITPSNGNDDLYGSSQTFHPSLKIPIPSQHLLPPYTDEELRIRKENNNSHSISYSNFLSSSLFSAPPVPLDFMLPPLTPEEERQKVLNSTNKVIPLDSVTRTYKNKTHIMLDGELLLLPTMPLPSDHLLPPLPEESKSSSLNEPQYKPFYSSSDDSEEYSMNWQQRYNKSFNPLVVYFNKTKQSTPNVSYFQHTYGTSRYPQSKEDKFPSPSSLTNHNKNPENNQVLNDSVIVQSPPLRVTTLTTSFLKSSTETPYSSTHNHEFHKGSPDSSEQAEISNVLIGGAIKTLLRPYISRTGKVTDEDVQKSESHIMKLFKRPNENEEEKQHEKDVEFIFTGEQPNLNKDIWEDIQSQVNHNDHQHHQHQSFGHSREFHRQHPNLPNSYKSTTDRTVLDRNYYPSSTQYPVTSPIPHSVYPGKVDVRITPNVKLPSIPNKDEITPDSGENCGFDCQNKKCIKEFEVCDGVNNCGNRLDEKYCDHLGYEVRLSNEEGGKHMGRVEVKILGKWGYICDDKFGMRDADVLCRELGFPLGASEVRGNSYYPPQAEMIDENNNVLFVMDEVDCKGNETSLKECDFKGWGVNDCTSEEVVGVVCKIPVMKCPHDYWMCNSSKECIPPAFVCDNVKDCADNSDEREDFCNSSIEYRLVDGDGRLEGRVEVKYRGTWGTICDDDFTETEAQVICNSLGFNGKAYVVKNAFGQGTGPIWLDQVSCYGNETSIDKCIHWTWGEHNCNHTEDVSIRCTEGTPSSKKENNGIKGRSSRQPEKVDSEEVDSYMYDEVERSSKAFNQQKKCGHFNPNLTDEFDIPEEKMQRVIQGSKAKRGHHPWQATIRTRGRGGKSTHWCGAVLISKRHLLTAAHCLMGYPKGAYFVRLGDHYANIAESSEVDMFIENWYVHENFRKGSHMNNDIALIELKSPVRFNDYIQPICLPPKNSSYDAGKMCTISGWGSIQSGLSTPSNQLRAAQVPVIADSVCKRPTVYGNTITEGMFCAGYLDEGTDACDGDSGGPLVCTSDDVETLYGIISWGQHCGYANKPGVYVKIAHFVDWIYDKINYIIQSRKNSLKQRN